MKKLDILPWYKYNLLTVLKEVEPDVCLSRKHRKFLFKCGCWNKKELRINSILHWWVVSCWCVWKQRSKENWKKNIKHWFASWKWLSRIYRIYRWMRSRCENIKVKDYKYYWGRAIKCEWKKFEEFYEDMKKWYKDNLTIDRIDNNWNYCKNNCRWATMKEQAQNKRNTLYINNK